MVFVLISFHIKNLYAIVVSYFGPWASLVFCACVKGKMVI